MDSEESMASENMELWKKALGSHWDDYKIPEGGYKTFNQFFTRELKNPRPVAEGDNVLAAPADSLAILLFKEEVFSGLNVLQGQQIGSLLENPKK